jgi:hypothetical protein
MNYRGVPKIEGQIGPTKCGLDSIEATFDCHRLFETDAGGVGGNNTVSGAAVTLPDGTRNGVTGTGTCM